MKRSLSLFLLLLPLTVFSQNPLLRQFFTTNSDPVVQATAGSNVFVTYTLAGQTRSYRIDVPTMGGTGSGIYVSSNYVELLAGVTNLNFIGATITTNSTNAVITITATGFNTNDLLGANNIWTGNSNMFYGHLYANGASLTNPVLWGLVRLMPDDVGVVGQIFTLNNVNGTIQHVYWDNVSVSNAAGDHIAGTNWVLSQGYTPTNSTWFVSTLNGASTNQALWYGVKFMPDSNYTSDDKGKVLVLGATSGLASFLNNLYATNRVPLRLDNWSTALTTNLFEIYSNGILRFVVRSNGNVGILNSAPTEALHVTGNVSVNAGSSFGFGGGASTQNASITGDDNAKRIKIGIAGVDTYDIMMTNAGIMFGDWRLAPNYKFQFVGNPSAAAFSINTNQFAVSNGTVIITKALQVGYDSSPYTNYYKTNTLEGLIPPTNFSFSVIFPTNIVTVVTNGLGTIQSNTIYGTSGSATINVPFTSGSSSTSAPVATEFVVAEWVRGLFAGGTLLYNCTNQQQFFTNMDLWYSALPTTNTVQQARTYNGVTNGQYLGTGIASTNRYSQVNSPMTVNAYLSFNTGGGRAVTVHPELYYCYSEPGTNGPGNYTNLLGDYSAGGQALIAGTNLYTWVISFPTVVSTNANGFWVIRRFKVDSQANNPNVTIHGSGNTPSTIGFSNPGITTSGMVQFDQNSVVTNVLLNGSFQSNTCGTATFDFSKPRQFTNTTTDITFNAVTGQAAVDVRTVALTITNSSGTAKLLTIPGTWNSPTNVYTVTNVSILSVESWGTYMTNAVCRGIK